MSETLKMTGPVIVGEGHPELSAETHAFVTPLGTIFRDKLTGRMWVMTESLNGWEPYQNFDLEKLFPTPTFSTARGVEVEVLKPNARKFQFDE